MKNINVWQNKAVATVFSWDLYWSVFFFLCCMLSFVYRCLFLIIVLPFKLYPWHWQFVFDWWVWLSLRYYTSLFYDIIWKNTFSIIKWWWLSNQHLTINLSSYLFSLRIHTREKKIVYHLIFKILVLISNTYRLRTKILI